MSSDTPKNIVASVEARLKNLSKQQGWNYAHILTRYATERFLYRLSISPYRDQFVLKGGNLFVIWLKGASSRPTIDTDLLRYGNATAEELQSIFTTIANTDEQALDGMVYDTSTIKVESIREATQYGGTRIVLIAYLGRTRSRLQFDIGVGDVVTPAPELTDFPVLLQGCTPRIKAYPMASVIAEKAQIIVSLGLLNSRMKDFYDIWLLSQQFEHDFKLLAEAIQKTFNHRGEAIPSIEASQLFEELSNSPQKQTQWKAFLRKNASLEAPTQLSELITQISSFLLPLLTPKKPTLSKWTPAHGWLSL